MSEINFNKFFPVPKERLFNYFAKRDLVERWQAPNGMTLKLPKFEARAGGTYRYEHTSKDGVYTCEGSFKEFNPGERIVQFDEFIRDPKGNTLSENMETIIDFQEKPGGTEVRLKSSGFANEEQTQMCQEGWEQCFEQLADLVTKDSGTQRGKVAPGTRELRT